MTKLRVSSNNWTDRLSRITDRISDDSMLDEEQKDSKIETYANLFQTLHEQKLQKEKEDDFKINNLEYDLRSTDWVAIKAKENKFYAQNLYAALCNNNFQKQDVWPIITNNTWSCSWRYAGGILADILEEGDYLDWYCSGIRDLDEKTSIDKDGRTYRAEGDVSEEIKSDLAKLGWQVIPSKEEL